MAMMIIPLSLLLLLLAAAQTSFISSSPTTSPAFMWSSHNLKSFYETNEIVNYQTLSPKNLANSVLSEGGWSKLLCSRSDDRHHLDFALIFIGSKLKSSYLSKRPYANQDLIDFVELAFRVSNFSMVFPYLYLQTGILSFEKMLVSEITNGCGEQFQPYDVAVMDSCLIGADKLKKLAGISAVHEYMDLQMQTKQNRRTNLIVVCPDSLQELEGPTEGKILSSLISILDNSGASYSVLYASDPTRSLDYPPVLSRLLSDSISAGNDAIDAVGCDGVCQIKSSLLEGIFVGIVLLIILLSGLCCMLGIDTPTKFEAPQDT